jgi:hypothetical protein
VFLLVSTLFVMKLGGSSCYDASLIYFTHFGQHKWLHASSKTTWVFPLILFYLCHR